MDEWKDDPIMQVCRRVNAETITPWLAQRQELEKKIAQELHQQPKHKPLSITVEVIDNGN